MTSKKYKIYNDKIENEALLQFFRALEHPLNVQGALMPDAHSGYTLPIGAVIKSKALFPSYVGYDIGCGVAAAKLDIDFLSKDDLIFLKKQIIEKIPLGKNSHTTKQKLYEDIKGTKLFNQSLKQIGLYQLGTLGSGNHFIEIGHDGTSYWVIVHSGSRNLGHKIATHYMKEAAIQNVDEERYQQEFFQKNREFLKAVENGKVSKEHFEQVLKEFVYRRTRARLKTNVEGHFYLDPYSDVGKDYLIDLNACLEYAYQNRKKMIQIVANSIGCNITEFINRHHNHAESVYEGDEIFFIHRKGATHAEKDMMGVVPGNMKDGSFIVKGLGNPESMSSSSHGAGRVLSRRAAKELIDFDSLKKEMNGIVTNISENTVDEAPDAYKNIFEVMNLQKELVQVVAHVKPILNLKG